MEISRNTIQPKVGSRPERGPTRWYRPSLQIDP